MTVMVSTAGGTLRVEQRRCRVHLTHCPAMAAAASQKLKLTWHKDTKFCVTPRKAVETERALFLFGRKEPAIRTEDPTMTHV